MSPEGANMLHRRAVLFLSLVAVVACNAQTSVTPGSAVGAGGVPTQTQSNAVRRPHKRLKPTTYSGPTTYGLEIPILSPVANCQTTRGDHWTCMLNTYFASSVFSDIAKNLHAAYVRTEWSYGEYQSLGATKYDADVDEVIGRACKAGLSTLLILGSPNPPLQNINKYLSDVANALYEDGTMNPGCIYRVEIDNEPNVPKSNFNADVSLYAEFYEYVAPVVGIQLGLKVVTGGTSGYKGGTSSRGGQIWCGSPSVSSPPPSGTEICGLDWVNFLSKDFEPPSEQPPVSCYGFHPYDAYKGPPSSPEPDMPTAMTAMDNAPVGYVRNICVTEIGFSEAGALATTLSQLNEITPLVTVYEYEQQGTGDKTNLWLVDHNGTHTALYDVVQDAF